MPRNLCGTEVQRAKDIANIKNIKIRPARRWLKEARQKLGMAQDADFTLRHLSMVDNIELGELLEMLNRKQA